MKGMASTTYRAFVTIMTKQRNQWTAHDRLRCGYTCENDGKVTRLLCLNIFHHHDFLILHNRPLLQFWNFLPRYLLTAANVDYSDNQQLNTYSKCSFIPVSSQTVYLTSCNFNWTSKYTTYAPCNEKAHFCQYMVSKEKTTAKNCVSWVLDNYQVGPKQRLQVSSTSGTFHSVIANTFWILL